jgi:SAM-dependent methyltransferase
LTQLPSSAGTYFAGAVALPAITKKTEIEKKLVCLLCGSSLELILTGLSDNRLGTPGTYEIRKCVHCGLEQASPLPTLSELTNLYEVHYNFGGEKGTAYTRLRDWFLASHIYRLWLLVDGDNSFYTCKGAGRLLDVGCNEGRGLQAYRRNGFAAEGIDLNRMAARAARELGHAVHEVPLEQYQPEAPYAVVVLSNVLEHTLDPKRMLLDAARILEPDGQVWISCPNSQSWFRWLFGRSWINWHVPFHISNFSSQNLRELLLETGFTQIKMRQTTPAAWVASSIIIKLFARPGKATLQLRNPILFAAVMLLVRALLFPILFISDRAGRGDCLIVTASKV